MTAVPLFAFVGPAAGRWRENLSSRALELVAESGPVAVVVVDADAPASATLPEATHLVVVGPSFGRFAKTARKRRRWRTAEGPDAWFGDFMDRFMSYPSIERTLDEIADERCEPARLADVLDPAVILDRVLPGRTWRLPDNHVFGDPDHGGPGGGVVGGLGDLLGGLLGGRGGRKPAAPEPAEPTAQDLELLERIQRTEPTASAMPGDDEPPATNGDGHEPVAPRTRHLVVGLWVGQEQQEAVLPPLTDVALTVKIAVPAAGEIAAAAPIDVPSEPGRSSVVLDVKVWGTPWPKPQTARISVPTADPEASSTLARFGLRTPASGGLVDVQIAVSYGDRVLQVAAVAAAVREQAFPGERISVVASTTSSGPLPSAVLVDAAPAGVQLDARADVLANLATGARVQVEVRTILVALGEALSREMGREDAPEDLTGDRARTLLVELARKGAGVKERLAPLGIADDAADISLLVHPHSEVLPLELVYDGPAPSAHAKVCGHATGGRCRGPSRNRVCPFGFWGATRRICRVVQLSEDRSEALERVHLSGVLYAAAALSDNVVRAVPGAVGVAAVPPSAGLFARLQSLAGATPERVTSWPKWCKAVREHGPGLLVLLAHAEQGPQDHVLVVGKSSQLTLADLQTDHVTRPGGPAPLVVLIACASSQASDAFGSFHGALVNRGAAAVVGTLGKLNGVQGAQAGAAIVDALAAATVQPAPATLGAVLLEARRSLLAQGRIVGLMLASHGEIEQLVAA